MAEFDLYFKFSFLKHITLKKKKSEQQAKKCNEENEHMLKTLNVKKKGSAEKETNRQKQRCNKHSKHHNKNVTD